MLLAVTMGDSSGVGPELILKAFMEGELADAIVIGDFQILDACRAALGFDIPLRRADSSTDIVAGTLSVVDLGLLTAKDLSIGTLSRSSGYAAHRYVETGTRLALSRSVDALVTLPMNKEATRLAFPSFTGHTELIAGMCGARGVVMMLASQKLSLTHVSTHVSLATAIRAVTRDRVRDTIMTTHEAMKRFLPEPRIAVAGLNPHAGENGAFGSEELREIAPAVSEARAAGVRVTGPEPPDTVFLRAVRGAFDAVVCMYHDQGHIPAKLLDFEGSVNVTLGLPIIRTSVDHGTAFDIAWKGIASTKSLANALRFARTLAGKS